MGSICFIGEIDKATGCVTAGRWGMNFEEAVMLYSTGQLDFESLVEILEAAKNG